MKPDKKQSISELSKTISKERGRTNLLKEIEQKTIAFLVQRIPSWINSDMLTAIGFLGSIIILLSFVLAAHVNETYLLIGVLGFMVSWFGDSLDGRLAYYRKIPRKWYGFTLDLTVDWLGIILMGLGFMIYANEAWKIVGFGFVVLYGWEIITALIRYKVTDKYAIDSGKFGPTEVRIIISLILIFEVIFKGSILYSSIIACVVLFIVNIIDTMKLLKLADALDTEEKETKINGENV
ncbi:MAG: CDP-alcohol phosphatidyltransferase [Bacteroidales bacterium]|nr:CDP-alcohol phosphatidyltransferase [Bacteroidales bacterium]